MNELKISKFLVEGVEVSILDKEVTIYDYEEEVSPKKGELICKYLCDENFLPKTKKLTFHILRPK
jgi:hypothetical protein